MLIAVDDPWQAVIQPSRLCANASVTDGRGIYPFIFSTLSRVALTDWTMADLLTALFIDPRFRFGIQALFVTQLIYSKHVIEFVTFSFKIAFIVVIGLYQDGNPARDFNTVF